jgi:hypothetical protein
VEPAAGFALGFGVLPSVAAGEGGELRQTELPLKVLQDEAPSQAYAALAVARRRAQVVAYGSRRVHEERDKVLLEVEEINVLLRTRRRLTALLLAPRVEMPAGGDSRERS